MKKEHLALRELAKRYNEYANTEQNKQNIKLHKAVNDLKQIRPIVLIDELPWHQMNVNGAFEIANTDEYLAEIEWFLRGNVYRWENVRGDLALRPYIAVKKAINTTGIGVQTMRSENEHTDTQAHHFVDQFQTEQDLDKLKYEQITYDEQKTKQRFELIGNIIGDVVPVKITGHPMDYDIGCKNWDDIVFFRGLDNMILDFVDKPEFMHKLVGKLTDIYLDKIRQYEQLNLFDGDAYYNHCASALTDDLKQDDDVVKAKDIWGRGLAQILATVSPQMHDEFDIQYMIKAMQPFGLVYYGCCEPLDKKIEILKQIRNLRKISITPWADIAVAADAIQKDYVISAKPNPAQVAVNVLDKESVKKELTHIVDTCRKNGSSLEIVLKDITTTCNRPENLFEWEQIAMDVVKNY